MGVATGALVVTTSAAIPPDIVPGSYNLEVVANGIASQPFAVTVGESRLMKALSPRKHPSATHLFSADKSAARWARVFWA